MLRDWGLKIDIFLPQDGWMKQKMKFKENNEVVEGFNCDI